MTVTASCGHDITNETEVMVSYMDYTRMGERAVCCAVLCEQCRKQYDDWGIILHNNAEESAWLSGKMEYPE